MTMDDWWEAVFSVILAAAGGLARLLNLKEKKALKWKRILGELFTAAFMGVLIFLLSREIKISSYVTCLIAGVAGWLGPKAMDFIIEFIGSLTNFKLIRKDDEGNTK